MNVYNEAMYKTHWLLARWDISLQVTILDSLALDRKNYIKSNATADPAIQEAGHSILLLFKEDTAFCIYYWP